MTAPPWPKMKVVTEDEMFAFLKAYPTQLNRDVCAIGDPPLITWNDFERAEFWPACVVAYCFGAREYKPGESRLAGPFHVLDRSPP